MNFKKVSASLLAIAMLAGCGSSSAAATTASEASEASEAPAASTEAAETAAAEVSDRPAPAESGNTTIDDLTMQFVPSRNVDDLNAAVSPLGDMLIEAMAKHGYTIGKVDITVSADYNAAGEALSAGTADIAWLPGGTYALYSNECDVILTATRNALSNDSENPADWNGDANATKRVDDQQVTYYKGLIYAGPSEKGKALAEKVSNGEKLTWDELNDATWAVQSSTTSSSGYIYPDMWLMDNYDGKTFADLAHVTQINGYEGAFQQAASEGVDIIVCYADGRQDYEGQWTSEWGRSDSIWNELNVIGVTQNIYNDTVSVTMADPDIYNKQFIDAFQQSMIEVAGTEEGKKIISIYSHNGYQVAQDSDYNGARQALTVVAE